MEPIFNFFSQTVGWLEGDLAFSADGHPVAFLSSGAVLASKSGRYLGQFNDGIFRDGLGCIVAFQRGAYRDAVLPTLLGARMPPEVRSRAAPGRASVPVLLPHPYKRLLNRSSLNWDCFVKGYKAQWPWETRR